MKKNDLITIIVPIYNMEKYLKKCLDSVINQTYKNLEILLVNDGSIDNSLKICQKYATKDQRIKIINKENKGLSSAKNEGILNAHGTYLAFIDADDYVDLDFINKLYNSIITTNSSISICGYYKVYNDNLEKSYTNNFILEDNAKYTFLLTKDSPTLISSCNKLYKKEIFNNLKYPEGYVHEDAYLIVDILKKSPKISFINAYLYYYRQRKDSICHTYNMKSLNQIDAFLHMKEFFINNKITYDKAMLDLKIYSELKYILWKIPPKVRDKDIYQEYVNLLKEYKQIVLLSKISIYQKIKVVIGIILPSIFMRLKDHRRNK